MNVPATNITTINKVPCFQYFENMVFDLKLSQRTYHPGSLYFCGIELKNC